MKKSQTEKTAAVERLREILKPGDRVYTVLRHVSKSGMSRRVDVIVPNAVPGSSYAFNTWTYLVALACGFSYNPDKPGLVITGCGTDVGFEIVYNLGRVLWPEGDGKYVTGRNGSKAPETDGGYLLRQEWI